MQTGAPIHAPRARSPPPRPVPPSLGSAFITPLAGGPPLPQLAAAHKEQIFVLYSHLGSVEINSILPAPPGGGMGRAGRMPFLTTAMPRSEGVGSPLLCPSNLPPPRGLWVVRPVVRPRTMRSTCGGSTSRPWTRTPAPASWSCPEGGPPNPSGSLRFLLHPRSWADPLSQQCQSAQPSTFNLPQSLTP